MPKREHLEHANHNSKVCNFLHKKEEYGDWIVITSFYAALHYVSHSIFPIQVTADNNTVNIADCVEEYKYLNNITNARSKHAILSDLVCEQLPEISTSYNRLKDLSFQARYQHYNFTRAISDDAKKKMEAIKAFCSSENE